MQTSGVPVGQLGNRVLVLHGGYPNIESDEIFQAKVAWLWTNRSVGLRFRNWR